MTWNDYIDETRENIKEYLRENYSKEELQDYISLDRLKDNLFMSDSVTGNASGSYTCNSYQAEQNVSGILWDSEFIEILYNTYGEDIGDCMKHGAEYLDVTARVLALEYMDLQEVIDEVYKEMEEEQCTN